MMRRTILLALLGSLLAVSLQAGVPYLVKDINENVFPAGSYPDDFVSLGNLAFFTTNTSNGEALELWRTDGTAAGTFKVGGRPESRAIWNGKLWFTTGFGANTSLWSSDGTVAGTQKMVLPTATPAIVPTYLMAGPTHLYFFNAGKLWRTDGTTGGTTQLTSVAVKPGTWYSDPEVLWSAISGSTLYFLADSGTIGVELWKTDGGVVSQVKDFGASTGSVFVAGNLVYVQLYVQTQPFSQWELWRSDGTAAGTFVLKSNQLLGTYDFRPLVHDGGQVYFTAGDSVNRKLWRTNGTVAGTVAVATSLPGSSSTFEAFPLIRLPNGTILLIGASLPAGSNGYGLWAFAGNTTTFLTNTPYGNGLVHAYLAGNVAVFGTGAKLWRSDGTIGGTYNVGFQDRQQGYNPWPGTSIGSSVVLAGYGDEHGAEIWKTDGSAAPATLVKDIVEGTYGSTPLRLVPFRGGVLFNASSDDVDQYDQNPTRDLWFSDGTAAGTQKLLPNFYDTGETTSCGLRAFFTHYTPEAGYELWVTDGTPAGTVLLKDINPTTHPAVGGDPAGPNSSNPGSFTCVDGIAYFFAHSGSGQRELWRSDGTASGTLLVKGIGALDYDPWRVRPVRLGHQIYFGSNDSPARLWRSDGTPGGTVVVRELGSEIHRVFVAGNVVYATTSEPNSFDTTLWRSDGTAAGTTALLSAFNLILGADFYGRLTYEQGEHGAYPRVCTTDGSGQGTCFEPAPPSGNYDWKMQPLNGRLYYTKSTLRSTDGLTEVIAGGEFRELLTTGGGLLYAIGDLVQNGGYIRLLESDGTLAGTHAVMDNSFGVTQAVSSGGRIFIAKDELYALDSEVTPTGFSPYAVPAPGGQTVTITGRGFTGPATIRVGGTSAVVGTVTPTSITFTAPAHDPGTYDIDLTLGSGRRMTLDQPLGYSCTATATATVNPAPVCPLTPVTLQGSGGTRCAWFPLTGLDDPSSCAPKATVAASTTYSLIVWTASGCPSAPAAVTVNVIQPPDATITIPGTNPDYAIGSMTSFAASVPDAGAGATYAWSGTGLTFSSALTGRSVTFSTTCEPRPTLTVAVTAASGCASTSTRQLVLYPPEMTSFSPNVANPGTTITITGSGLGCIAPLQLQGYDEVLQTITFQPIAVTKVNGTTAEFRLPATAQRQNFIREVTPTFYSRLSGTLFRSSRRDFNRDVRADVFWRNSSTGATSVWTLSSYYPTFTGYTSAPVPPSWTLAAFGDFNGDARSDLFWHHPATGETSIWLMNGPNPSTTVRSTTVPVGWKPVGSVDFDGDGQDDLFWHNPATGETSIWFMNGTTIARAIRSLTVPTDWRPAAFGDFNLDTRGDVVWLRPSTGETSIWLMNGSGTPATAVRSDTVPAPWTLAGCADFDADLRDDLLWHNPTTGATQIWQMNGATIVAKTAGVTMLPGFQATVVGQFDGGGAADVFWYNPTTGETAIWRRDFSYPIYAPISKIQQIPDLNWKPVR
jgi:ELWxxDGT repeat protein